MEHSSLYRLLYDCYLPILENPAQQIVWSENPFEKGTVLLYLQDFDLREENLGRASITAAHRTTKGSLFLAPDLQKIWLSRYEIEYLKKISSF